MTGGYTLFPVGDCWTWFSFINVFVSSFRRYCFHFWICAFMFRCFLSLWLKYSPRPCLFVFQNTTAVYIPVSLFIVNGLIFLLYSFIFIHFDLVCFILYNEYYFFLFSSLVLFTSPHFISYTVHFVPFFVNLFLYFLRIYIFLEINVLYSLCFQTLITFLQ